MTTAETETLGLQLPTEFVESYRDFQVPWGPIGYVTYKRTYARPLVPERLQHIDGYYNQLLAYRAEIQDEEGEFPTEEWVDTNARCVNWALREARGALSVEEAKLLFDDLMNIKCTFSGRAMWQAGTSTVDRLGGASLLNCWYVSIDSLDAFLFAFDMLMLGGGVGFSIQKEFVYELPKVMDVRVTNKETNDADFIVPDSREGWIELVRRTLEAYFVTGKSFTYSTVAIRKAGAPIASFGGKASGPGPLRVGITHLCKLLSSRVGKKLNPTGAMDVMCILGDIVVSGNVRRSALIAIGDHEDNQFLMAKRFDLSTQIPNYRSKSNNTVVCNDIEHLSDKFWKTYMVPGEPYGLFNKALCQRTGRTKDTHRPDRNVQGLNPCAEATLPPWASCNLVENHIKNIASREEFIEVSARIFKVAKIVSCIPLHWEQASEISKKERRIGCGITGVADVINRDWGVPFEQVLSDAYENIERVDVEFSEALTECRGHKVVPSVKLTVIKPAGTSSKLSGSSSGANPSFSSYYIQRMRMASNSATLAACKAAGYPTEPERKLDGTLDMGVYVVEFPVAAPEGALVADDMTAIQQLEVVKMLQTHWADQAVSSTINYKQEELPEIQAWLLANYKDSIKSVSFLQYTAHGFDQAPWEATTEKDYLRRTKNLQPLDLSNSHVLTGDELGADCEGGGCPIR